MTIIWWKKHIFHDRLYDVSLPGCDFAGAEQEQTPVPVGDGDQDVFVIEDGEPG